MRMISLLAIATLSLASSAAFAAEPMRMCTASPKGNYTAFGNALADELKGTMDVQVIPTAGSWDNLTKLKNNECDAVMVQSDADAVYRSVNAGSTLPMQRVGSVFNESLNLICNANLGIDDLDDLVDQKPKISVGDRGSGSWVSWQGLVFADKTEGGDEYSAIPTDKSSGTLALTQVVDGSDVGCMFFTMSKGSSFMDEVVAAAGDGDILNIVDISDKDFNDTVDAKGKSLYTPVEVDYEGFGRWGDVDTYTIPALLYVSQAWQTKDPDGFNNLVTTFLPTVANFKATRGLE